MLRYLLPLLSTVALAGEGVNGNPEPPTPEPHHQPRLWLETTNDDFAPRAQDDGLTYSFAGGLHLYGAMLGVDMSSYTHRIADSHTDGTRSDELTLTVGSRVYRSDRAHVTVAAGARFAGDYGGEKVQDWWHGICSVPQNHLPYERGRRWEPVLVVDAQRTLWMVDGTLGVQPRLEFLGSNHHAEWQVTVPLVYMNSDMGSTSGDCILWVGPGYRGYEGQSMSRTAGWYNDQITGPIMAFGMRLQGFTVDLTLSPNRQYGSFGFSF